MRSIVAAGCAAVLMTGVVCEQAAAEVRAADIIGSDGVEALFDRLDLRQSGMEDVRAAVSEHDYDRAIAALGEYYRTREGTYHFVDPNDPMAEIDDVESRQRAGEQLVNREGSWDARYWDGDTFDWERAEIRRKWRMYFFQTLGEAAALDESGEVARELVNLIRSFVEQYTWVEDGERVWRTMPAGIRMRTGWARAFMNLLATEAFTDDDIVLFLHSVWQHSDFIYHNRSETSNWLTFEMAGLYTAGVVYPEFRDARTWRRMASRAALDEMERGWLPDGMSVELSPGYGQYFTNFFTIYDLAKHVGRLEEFGLERFPPLTEPIYHAYLQIMAPDRYAPATNHNRPRSVQTILEPALERFPDREDFRWAVTDGEEGEKPDFTSAVLPYAGFAAMRSGWERDDHMIYFLFGPPGYRHVHQDGLAVMMWAYGRQVLFDPGLVGNEHSDPFHMYGRDTFSHNTVLVDNRPQRRAWYDNPHPDNMPYRPVRNYRWESTDEYDHAYGVYDEAYGPAGQGVSHPYPYSDDSNFDEGWVYPVEHHRRVLFVKPDIFLVADTMIPNDRNQEHEYDARWHLDSTSVEKSEDGLSVITADEGKPNLEVVPLLSEDMTVRATSAQRSPEKLGWSVLEADNPEPATTVQHIKEDAGRVQFLTLLVPLEPGERSLLAEAQQIDPETVEITLRDGRQYVVNVPDDPRQDLSAERVDD